MAAYLRAVEEGADAFECDVRLTRDEELVCIHDATIDRTSSGRGRVSSMSLAELAELDWGSWKPGAAPAALLTLNDLLELRRDLAASGRRLDVAIETKHPSRFGGRLETRLAETLAARDLLGPGSPVRVMSFSPLALRRMRRLAPELAGVYLMDLIPVPLRDGRLPAGVAAAGIGVQILRDRPDQVRRLREAGYAVHVWTVDEEQDVDRCLRVGVDAIITNRPGPVRRQVVGGDG